ncbi:MAG: hypothetical protein GYB42_03380 [Alphaproteobacteria bacterium]|nr:hypothetical protein [Alphaproteobacteria bacterium]
MLCDRTKGSMNGWVSSAGADVSPETQEAVTKAAMAALAINPDFADM